MFKDMSVGDQEKLFSGALVIFNKKFTKVERISPGEMYVLKDLQTQKSYVEKSAYKKITPPYTRIGMLNICGSVVYCERRPIRQYHVGFTRANTSINMIGTSYPDGLDNTMRHAARFDTVEVFESLTNKYPSFEEALAYAEDFGCAKAFDKQFAVTESREIFYKTKNVGKISDRKAKVDQIVFKPGFEALKLLVGNEYEKAVSNS